MTSSANLPVVFDFEADQLIELCHDPAGIPVDLIEITGVRVRDRGVLRASVRDDLVRSFTARPERRRLVVWTDAAWLEEHEPAEYAELRDWLEAMLRDVQNPWQLPPTGQVGGAILAGALPDALASHRSVPRRDLDYTALRPPDRRSQPRD